MNAKSCFWSSRVQVVEGLAPIATAVEGAKRARNRLRWISLKLAGTPVLAIPELMALGLVTVSYTHLTLPTILLV